MNLPAGFYFGRSRSQSTYIEQARQNSIRGNDTMIMDDITCFDRGMLIQGCWIRTMQLSVPTGSR